MTYYYINNLYFGIRYKIYSTLNGSRNGMARTDLEAGVNLTEPKFKNVWQYGYSAYNV